MLFCCVRIEVFTAVKVKTGVLWDVTSWTLYQTAWCHIHSRKPCFSLYFAVHIYNKAVACLQVSRFYILVGSVFQGYEAVSVGNLIPKSWGKVMFWI